MKIITAFLFGILAVAGIGGAAIVGLAPGMSSPQTRVAGVSVLQALATPTAVLTPTAADNSDMVITLSERYLNQNIAQGIPQGGQVSNVQLDLHPGNTADLHATLKLNTFVTLQPKLALQLGIANGLVTIDVTSVDVGGFGVPSSLIQPQIDSFKAMASAQLNAQLTAMSQSTGLKLQSLTTTENSLTVSFAQ